jgi:hypothetical protein
MIEIIDNYLPHREYDSIRAYFEGDMDGGAIHNSCAWMYYPGITLENDGHFQFVQLIFSQYTILSDSFNLLSPIIQKERMCSIARIKANCVIKTPEVIEFTQGFHTDFNSDLMTGIYYINSNDGYTLFEDGTKCESVANRFCRFPARTKHTGTTCTNTNRRLVLNFNYSTYDTDN